MDEIWPNLVQYIIATYQRFDYILVTLTLFSRAQALKISFGLSAAYLMNVCINLIKFGRIYHLRIDECWSNLV